MSYAEAPVETILRFIETPSWQIEGIGAESLSAQLISVSRETNRKPDSTYFEVVDGELCDSITKESVLSVIKRETPLQETEYQAAVQIQDWAATSDEGIAVWISPRFSGEYPCEKISIHQIAYKLDGTKVVLNSYILFDANLRNTEDLRRFIFTEPDSEEAIPGILSWIHAASRKSVNTDTADYGEVERQAAYFAGQIRAGVDPNLVVREMQEAGFLGNNPISCPGVKQSFSSVLGSRSEVFIFSEAGDQYGSLTFSCDKCKSMNTRPYSKLISNCQHCGTDVKCG